MPPYRSQIQIFYQVKTDAETLVVAVVEQEGRWKVAQFGV